MANFGDPKVKEWMKEHPKEVAKVREKYDELRAMTLEDLFIMAPESAVAEARNKLIVGIIAAGK